MKRRMFLMGLAFLMIGEISASSAWASRILAGTYTYSQAPTWNGPANTGASGDRGLTGPINYTSSSVLGDGNVVSTSALWDNGSDQLDYFGVFVVFDLGDVYQINSITTSHYITQLDGIGAVDFYYSIDGATYTLLGSNGSNQYCRASDSALGWLTRSITPNANVCARYIKLHVYSVPWYHLVLSDVIIDGELTARILSGTYTYSSAPTWNGPGNSSNVGDRGLTGPIDYTISSVQGDGNVIGTSALWNNGSNQIGSNGVYIIFNLGTAYQIRKITTSHYISQYDGIGAVDFYYGIDGTNYTLLGSNGSNQYCGASNILGWLSRSMTAGTSFTAQYIKLHVHSVPWYHLVLSEVVIDGLTPTSAPTFTPGGKYISGPTPITITCPANGAQIYYTTDGSVPTTNSTPYTVPVTVSSGTVLQAIAQASGYNPSSVASMTYVVPSSYNRPETIPYGSATVDGDLSDWTGATWAPIDQIYNISGTTADALNADIPEAYYAARWQANKVYVAVRVRDTGHSFKDDYDSWNTRDAIEVYLHTDNNGALNYPDATTAQQYIMGFMVSDPTKLWTAVSVNVQAVAVPDDGSMDALVKTAGKIDGEWLDYEVEMTPFTYLGYFVDGNLSSSVISQLFNGGVVGLDVCIVGNADGTYTGMKSENTITGAKYTSWELFGKHKLGLASGDANGDGMVDVGDLGILAANYGLTSGATWAQGDFNGDGAVDVGDLGILAANYGVGTQSGADFNADYAKVFGTSVAEDTATSTDDADTDSTPCSSLGLSLIAGLLLAGLMLVKLEE